MKKLEGQNLIENICKKLAASYETRRSAICPSSEPHESISQAETVFIEHPFNIIAHRVQLLIVLFPSDFLTKIVKVCLCPIHPIHFDLISGNIFDKK
jgi:hypothetical protein